MESKIEVMGFASVHLDEAFRSAQRAALYADQNRPAEHGGAAAASILMASAALEAYLSEYATLAILPDDVRAEIRDGNDSLPTRYLRLLEEVASNRSEAENSEEYKNLRCLIELRHAVAHRKAALLNVGQWPKDLVPCRRRIPFHSEGTHHWTSVLLVASVARWAAETALAWIKWCSLRLGKPLGPEPESVV